MGNRPGLFRRLTADAESLDAARLRSEVGAADAKPCRILHRGDVAKVTGRVRSVVYNPRQTVPTFTAELFDGSASIDLVWLGRRRIAGITPGRTVHARGRIGDHDGRLAIYNPRYELQVPA